MILDTGIDTAATFARNSTMTRQVLTAIGSMLGHALNNAPEDALARPEEVRRSRHAIRHNNIRMLSQALHPPPFYRRGRVKALRLVFSTWAGKRDLVLHYEKRGAIRRESAGVALSIRVPAEALNNVSRIRGHWTRIWLRFSPDSLELEVGSHGTGFVAETSSAGSGWGRWRGKRAELLAARWPSHEPQGRARGDVPVFPESKWMPMEPKITVLLADDPTWYAADPSHAEDDQEISALEKQRR